MALFRRARADDARGDATALAALLLRIYRPVRHHLTRRLRGVPNHADAARDVTQEVLVRVLDGMADCRARSDRQFWAWIWQIARNAGTDYLRQYVRHRGDERQAAVRAAIARASWRAWRDLLAPEPPEPEARLVRHVMACYEQLPDRTAELIWYRLVVSASFSEIARIYGITRAAARRRWQRAREALQRAVLTRLDRLQDEAERTRVCRALRVHRTPRGAARRGPDPDAVG